MPASIGVNARAGNRAGVIAMAAHGQRAPLAVARTPADRRATAASQPELSASQSVAASQSIVSTVPNVISSPG